MGGARGVGVAAAATSDPYGSSFASGGVLRRVEGAQGRRGGVQSGDVALGGRLGRGHGTVWCTGCAPRMRLHAHACVSHIYAHVHMHVYRTYRCICTWDLGGCLHAFCTHARPPHTHTHA